MARVPTTFDPFNAVAEPKRRQLLDALTAGELPVNDLVGSLGWPQPQVSKHLAVLRQVGLVHVRRQGRQKVYALDASCLRPIHDWVNKFERFWSHHLARIKTRAEAKAKTAKPSSRESELPHHKESEK
jgi:DNA-binding transcriptional ArsR family regulator